MTMTVSELERQGVVDELARAAGLDPNLEPARYNNFAAFAEQALDEAERRGRYAIRMEWQSAVFHQIEPSVVVYSPVLDSKDSAERWASAYCKRHPEYLVSQISGWRKQ